MLQSQYDAYGREQPICIQGRNPLLTRHPVLLPLLLLAGACIAAITSLAAQNIFPVLTLIGVSPFILGLSIGLVLGISGILTSIIGIIELIDKCNTQTKLFSRAHSIGIFDGPTHTTQEAGMQRAQRSRMLFQSVRGYCNEDTAIIIRSKSYASD